MSNELDQMIIMEYSSNGEDDWIAETRCIFRDWFHVNVVDLWDDGITPDSDIVKLMRFVTSDDEVLELEPSLAGFCRLRKLKEDIHAKLARHQNNFDQLVLNALAQRDKNMNRETELCKELVDGYAQLRDEAIIYDLRASGETIQGYTMIDDKQTFVKLRYRCNGEWYLSYWDDQSYKRQVTIHTSDIFRVVPRDSVLNVTYDIKLHNAPE